MSHSPEQNRKKAEAMRDAEHHANNASVDKMSFKEQRYNHVMHNMDSDFKKSDAEYRSGKLNEEQYRAKQHAQESKNKEYISDLSNEEKSDYKGRHMRNKEDDKKYHKE